VEDYIHRLNKNRGMSRQRFRMNFSDVITERKIR